jgi:hypothetical protein
MAATTSNAPIVDGLHSIDAGWASALAQTPKDTFDI